MHKTKEWFDSFDKDEHLFVAALQSNTTCHLHGITTEQGAESQNSASTPFRQANSVEKKGLSERYSHKRTDLEVCVSKYTDLGV